MEIYINIYLETTHRLRDLLFSCTIAACAQTPNIFIDVSAAVLIEYGYHYNFNVKRTLTFINVRKSS